MPESSPAQPAPVESTALPEPSYLRALLEERIPAVLKPLIHLGVVAQVVLACVGVITAIDFAWQFREGQLILEQGTIPQSVLNAFGGISDEFANQYVLYEVVLATIHRFLGWTGLIAFFAVLRFLIFARCLAGILRAGRRCPLHLVTLFLLTLLLISFRIEARPELVANVCFIALGSLLLGAGEGAWTWRIYAAVAGIFCIWANVHGTFLFGGVLLAFWMMQRALGGGWAYLGRSGTGLLGLGAAALLGTALNPHGVSRFLQPLLQHQIIWPLATSWEMWPTVPYTLSAYLEDILVVAALLLTFRLRSRPYWLLASVLLHRGLCYSSNRFLIFLGLSVLLLIQARLAEPWPEKGRPRWLVWSGISVLGQAGYVLVIALLVNLVWLGRTSRLATDLPALYPGTLLSTNQAFCSIIEHPPARPTVVMSWLDAQAWCQLSPRGVVVPWLDSGTHRFSEEDNRFYFLNLFDPATFQQTVDREPFDVIILGKNNYNWALLLNCDQHWSLAQVFDDSLLYRRTENKARDEDVQVLLAWQQAHTEKEQRKSPTHEPYRPDFNELARGCGLLPDGEALRQLQQGADLSWVKEPSIDFLEAWLQSVPAEEVAAAAHEDAALRGLSGALWRTLYARRLHDPQLAQQALTEFEAEHLPVYQQYYGELQNVRAEAYLQAGQTATARAILVAQWPRPRFSLRWGKLCREAFRDDLDAMPLEAKRITEGCDEAGFINRMLAEIERRITARRAACL